MGFIEDRFYDRRDTCGRRECDLNAREQDRAERDDAHDKLDRDMDW